MYMCDMGIDLSSTNLRLDFGTFQQGVTSNIMSQFTNSVLERNSSNHLT
jgi:hypothetical protein